MMWCQAPYIRGSPMNMAGRMLRETMQASTVAP